MKQVDFIWFIEHISRELDVACAVKALFEKKYHRSLAILPYYSSRHNQIVKEYQPKVVLLPFCYSIHDSGLGHYLPYWRDSFYINLSWEQIFYKANMEYKAPRDTFSKNFVLHHSWSTSRTHYLEKKGIDKARIFTNGHPAYALYFPPYNQVFGTREQLAKKTGLDKRKKWIFFPENYSWFFYTDDYLEAIIRNGQDRNVAYTMRDYCAEAFKIAMSWLDKLVSLKQDIEVILRPRPAVNLKYFIEEAEKYLDKKRKNIHITKDFSVREWIRTSDAVISSFSTSLIEGAIAQKPIFMLVPKKIPPALQSPWYQYVKTISSFSELNHFLRLESSSKSIYKRLGNWAKKNFLNSKDPIIGLVDFLGKFTVASTKAQVKYLNSYYGRYHHHLFDFMAFMGKARGVLGKFKQRFTKDSYYYSNDDVRLFESEMEKKKKIFADLAKQILNK